MGLARSYLIYSSLVFVGGCSDKVGSCTEYASQYSCSYVENDADYQVWYWRNVEADNEVDDTFIGHAKGLEMCEGNAKAFAAAIGENFNERAYICGLMDDGKLMEKHRFLNVTTR